MIPQNPLLHSHHLVVARHIHSAKLQQLPGLQPPSEGKQAQVRLENHAGIVFKRLVHVHPPQVPGHTAVRDQYSDRLALMPELVDEPVEKRNPERLCEGRRAEIDDVARAVASLDGDAPRTRGIRLVGKPDSNRHVPLDCTSPLPWCQRWCQRGRRWPSLAAPCRVPTPRCRQTP